MIEAPVDPADEELLAAVGGDAHRGRSERGAAETLGGVPVAMAWGLGAMEDAAVGGAGEELQPPIRLSADPRRRGGAVEQLLPIRPGATRVYLPGVPDAAVTASGEELEMAVAVGADGEGGSGADGDGRPHRRRDHDREHQGDADQEPARHQGSPRRGGTGVRG